MKFLSSQRFLAIYSGVLTVAFAAVVLMGATSATREAKFNTIDVRRINVVEPDGTLRMVISNAADAPGSPFHGHEYQRPDRKVAGIIFMNDEGTEEGGLIFGGKKDKDGKVSSFGHLSFDNYDQDQSMVIQNLDNSGGKSTYLEINDEPGWSLGELFKLEEKDRNLSEAQRKAVLHRFFETHPRSQHRAYFGTNEDHSSDLVLKDPQGRSRIALKVAADGTPTLQFLDASGKVIQQLPGMAQGRPGKK